MSSVFDFNPFEVGNWMTLGLMEEEEQRKREQEDLRRGALEEHEEDYEEGWSHWDWQDYYLDRM